MLICSALFIFGDEAHQIFRYEILYGQLTLTLIILCTYMYLVWRGTSYEIFFSHTSFCLLYSSSLMFFLTNFGLFIYEKQLTQDASVSPIFKFEVYFTRFFSMFNVSYFLGSYMYYGCCKRKFKYES